MLYHVGESRHTQNIQMNGVTGEDGKYVFYLMEKPHRLFGQPDTVCTHMVKDDHTIALHVDLEKVHVRVHTPVFDRIQMVMQALRIRLFF